MNVIYCILFELQLKYVVKYLFLIFVNTCGYPWVSVNVKKLCGYSHNGYPTDIDTDTGWIFIKRIGYGKLLPMSYLPVDIPKCMSD